MVRVSGEEVSPSDLAYIMEELTDYVLSLKPGLTGAELIELAPIGEAAMFR